MAVYVGESFFLHQIIQTRAGSPGLDTWRRQDPKQWLLMPLKW